MRSSQYIFNSTSSYCSSGDSTLTFSENYTKKSVPQSSSLRNTIAHAVTMDNLSPVRRESSVSVTNEIASLQKKKRAFESISTNQQEKEHFVSSPKGFQIAESPFQHIGEIQPNLAFSEEEDDDDFEGIVLMQHRSQQQKPEDQGYNLNSSPFGHEKQRHLNNACIKPHPAAHDQSSAVTRPLNYVSNPYNGVALSRIPAIGYRSYQPDVLKDIFR